MPDARKLNMFFGNDLRRTEQMLLCRSCATVGFGVPQPNTRTVCQTPWFHFNSLFVLELESIPGVPRITLIEDAPEALMNRRTTILLGSFAIAALAASAQAQTKSRPRTGGMTAAPSKPSATPKRPVRTASIPASPPAQPIVVNTTGFPAANIPGSAIPRTTGSNISPLAPVALAHITYYPTVILSDGRVLANFGTGRGYEQVLRKCAQIVGPLPPGVTMAPCWTVDAYGRFVVIQQH